jgi:hypothetical protein
MLLAYPRSFACAKFGIAYHQRFIPEGVAEPSQILLRDAHVLPITVRNTADVTSGKPITV